MGITDILQIRDKLVNNTGIDHAEVELICDLCEPLFRSQSNIIQLATPVQIVGDIHGQFDDLLEIFKISGFPPYSSYLFLGDLVDRGMKGVEVICLLLCYKILYPNLIHVIRGNHETRTVTSVYGFYRECNNKYPNKHKTDKGIDGSQNQIWARFMKLFDFLPIAALVTNDNKLSKIEHTSDNKKNNILNSKNTSDETNSANKYKNETIEDIIRSFINSPDNSNKNLISLLNSTVFENILVDYKETQKMPSINSSFFVRKKLFCVHAGISPLVSSLHHIKCLYRFGEIPPQGVLNDLVWSDPEVSIEGFKESPRGAGYMFGKDVSEEFVERNEVDSIVRAHQLCMNGYTWHFNRKVITVWSAPNYCKRAGNIASVMETDEYMNVVMNIFDEAKENNKISKFNV
eukprot:GAHX01001320.1.p1 GENE.GAHX01001320.1~~GAHX01001320.1.p1  ORF type:complete len:403 (-),score=49.46 GAHX01001320.1:15-1223(-)